MELNNILESLCSPIQFGKWNGRANFTNKAVNKFTKVVGSASFIVVYGDGSFPLSMEDMDDDGSAHKPLTMLVLKKVRIVITNNDRTTS